MKIRPPKKAIIELTRKCNMSCVHCASSAGKVRPSEISFDRMLSLIDELKELGVKDVVFSGGEPLLYKKWHELASKVRDYGMNLGLVCNGTYVIENADYIAKYITGFSMSLDGLKDVHNYIRQDKNAFKDVMDSFKLLRKKNVYSFAVTSVSKINFHQLEDIYKLLLEYEVVGWQVQLTFASGRMKEMKQEILTPKDLFKLHEFLLKVRQDDLIELHTGDNIGYNTAEDEIMRGYKWSGCQAGISVVSIEADGNVKGCLCQLPELIKDKKFVEGNINTRSIKDLWYDDRLFGYSRKFDFSQVDGFCKSCRYLERCKCGCTAFAYYATGTKYSNPYCLYALMSTE